MQLRWNQAQHRLANDLLGRVAENAAGCSIPAQDCAVKILGNDSVIGGFDNGSEKETSIVGPRQVRPVENDLACPDNFTVCAQHRRNRHGNTDVLTVSGDAFGLMLHDTLTGANLTE